MKKLFIEYKGIVHGEEDALTSDGKIQPQQINSFIFGNLLLKSIQELNLKVDDTFFVKEPKENIQILDSSFTIDNLKPVSFKNLKTNKTDLGLIVDQVKQDYPYLVKQDKETNNESINYVSLIPVLIKEIQELKIKVKILEDNQKQI